MFQTVAADRFERLEIGVPAFATLILIPLTFSITQGILWGFILHALLHRRRRPSARDILSRAASSRSAARCPSLLARCSKHCTRIEAASMQLADSRRRPRRAPEDQEARRQVDRAARRRAAVGQARSRGQQRRRPDAPHGRQHALALDRLPAPATARSPTGIAIRSSRTIPRDRAALIAEWEDGWRRVFDALGPLTDADLQEIVYIRAGAALDLQGHQPPGRALRRARLSDPAARQAPQGRRVEDAVDSARPVRGVQPPHAREAAAQRMNAA